MTSRTREGMKIAVVGPGGVGGYFGAKLAEAGYEVHFVGRGAHLEAIRKNGLTIKSPEGDIHIDTNATADPSDIGQCDYVLFCVKSMDTVDAARRLHPLLGHETAVISLQNGVDNEDRIAAHIGPKHVMAGAAFVFATIAEPGIIVRPGGPARIVFGEMDRSPSERAQRLLQICVDAQIDAEISNDISNVLWRKFALICAVGGMTAASRLPIGEVRSDETAFRMFRRIVEEAVAVAEARGVDLPEDTVEQGLQFARDLPSNAYSSLHYDLVNGKPMELEALHGTLVSIGREAGLNIPMSEAVYALLKPWELHNSR